MTVRALSPIALATAAALLASGWATPSDAREPREKRARGKAQATARPAAPGCKEPAAKDPALASGLEAYAAGRMPDAAAQLAAWAAKPGADEDPGAARGLYSLAFAQRATGNSAAAAAILDRVEPLLRARIETAPSLEAWYYLQGVSQMRGDTAGQLGAVSSALKALEAGLCAQRDGDDWFRVARLHAFAGNAAAKSEALGRASETYAALPQGAPAPQYRALVEKELGDAALTSNDLESAEKHLAVAAKLDPSIPGVHRQLGLTYLRRGNIDAAAQHWRSNWRNEREGGNSFMYALPVMNKILQHRTKGTAEPLTGLSQYTLPALEENAKTEAQEFLVLKQELAEAQAAGAALDPEKVARMDAAEYRCLQYLLEYVTRGQDLQEFALQNGLLPVIHGKGLPTRT